MILAIAALPYAFATAAQTMAVLVGGIDLSVAAMMTLTSVGAAVLMEGQGEEFGIVAVALILLLGLGLGTVNGLSIVLTRVPDIVVTLAFFFIWEGAALHGAGCAGRLVGAAGSATSSSARSAASSCRPRSGTGSPRRCSCWS